VLWAAGCTGRHGHGAENFTNMSLKNVSTKLLSKTIRSVIRCHESHPGHSQWLMKYYDDYILLLNQSKWYFGAIQKPCDTLRRGECKKVSHNFYIPKIFND